MMSNDLEKPENDWCKNLDIEVFRMVEKSPGKSALQSSDLVNN